MSEQLEQGPLELVVRRQELHDLAYVEWPLTDLRPEYLRAVLQFANDEIERLQSALEEIADAKAFDNIGRWARNKAREALPPNAELTGGRDHD